MVGIASSKPELKNLAIMFIVSVFIIARAVNEYWLYLWYDVWSALYKNELHVWRDDAHSCVNCEGVCARRFVSLTISLHISATRTQYSNNCLLYDAIIYLSGIKIFGIHYRKCDHYCNKYLFRLRKIFGQNLSLLVWPLFNKYSI